VGLFWIRLVMYVSVCFVAALQPFVVIFTLRYCCYGGLRDKELAFIAHFFMDNC